MSSKKGNYDKVIKEQHLTFRCRYLAPEYFMYGKVNNKIDVYAYGVVLLELLSGRKPISNEYPKGQESLVMWVSVLVLMWFTRTEFHLLMLSPKDLNYWKTLTRPSQF